MNKNMRNIKFEEFLKRVVPKIGAKAAFDLARDAKSSSLKKLLIKKNIITKEEIESIEDEELQRFADNIEKMPPPPAPPPATPPSSR